MQRHVARIRLREFQSIGSLIDVNPPSLDVAIELMRHLSGLAVVGPSLLKKLEPEQDLGHPARASQQKAVAQVRSGHWRRGQ
jgi:hypothetical protein